MAFSKALAISERSEKNILKQTLNLQKTHCWEYSRFNSGEASYIRLVKSIKSKTKMSFSYAERFV